MWDIMGNVMCDNMGNIIGNISMVSQEMSLASLLAILGCPIGQILSKISTNINKIYTTSIQKAVFLCATHPGVCLEL